MASNKKINTNANYIDTVSAASWDMAPAPTREIQQRQYQWALAFVYILFCCGKYIEQLHDIPQQALQGCHLITSERPSSLFFYSCSIKLYNHKLLPILDIKT